MTRYGGSDPMTHQDDDLSVDDHLFQTLSLNLKLGDFRKRIQQNIHKLKITMDEGLSPYIYVDWLKKGDGGVIWGHRFMIEVPFPYETVVTDPEYELQSVNVLLECVKDRYPFFQEMNVLLIDSGWARRGDQAVLVVQTRINFIRELFHRLKELSLTPPALVGLYLQRDGRLKIKKETEDSSIPLYFTLSAHKWKIIRRMKWQGGVDSFPLEYYSQLEWFFQMVTQVKQAFIRLHTIALGHK